MKTESRFDQLIADGLAASHDGRDEAALAFFSEAGALAPTSGVPSFLIAAEHAGAGNMEAAEAAFADAVLLAPGFHMARYQLGLLQFSAGRDAVGLLTWQPLLDLAASDPLHHFVRGFAALVQNRFEDALHHYRVGLACEQPAPAVSADIQKIVQQVERLAHPDEQVPEAAEDAGASHVLLSGYARGLH
ncbi:MAG TPA: hypothetical protein VFE82_19915 [Ramlibacter sp.]|jgi:Flp pilus assembly protein TadD|uniref:hypothetical protein n=1 Tax=Ramlibacter sp. TaxID=1917967 RepID=UPI002D745C61|nr:hypothetical protein [Ramlibacter sp.]HZY20745.1 hypothetical protein [Ramlibacter sp.]